MRKTHLFILLNLLGVMITKAQSVLEQVRSPQIADMIRYDNTPVSLNSGRLDLRIPLIGINDKDFTFPVTASYNSAGFMPSKPETILGLNWSLALGGVIYREVKGIPDDIDDFDIKGFVHIIKDKKNYDSQAVINNPGQYLFFTSTQSFKDTRIEANPDLYHFQFGEYSGTFSIGYDGNPIIIAGNGGNLKVDLSNYNTFDPRNPSIFKITADNGYQYYFGGSRDNMEFSIPYVNSVGHASSRIYPSAFFLYKIVAPNGRELNVSYKKIPSSYTKSPFSITYEENYLQDLKDYTVNFSFTAFWNSDIVIGDMDYSDHGWNVGNYFGSSRNYILTKIALIDEVTCGNQKLKFNYSPRASGYERFKDTSLTLSSRCGAMLDSVNLYYKDKPVKKVKFQYNYYGGTGKAFFLTRLTMPDNGSYKFVYKDVNTLPDPMDADVDYWNFWRGGIQGKYPIPEIAVDQNLDYKYTSDIREPNPEYCDVSLLKTIEFPTGGNAEIEYEPHLYSKKIDRNSASSFLPAIVNLASNQIAGGARVKSITYSDRNNRNVKSVGYEYTLSKSDKLSSGILTYFPKYYEIIWYAMVRNTLVPIDPPSLVYSNTGLNIPSYEQDHVRYSTVREVSIENTLIGNSTYSSPVVDLNTGLRKMASTKIEKGVGYWTITGMKPGGYVDIYIKQNGVTKANFRLNDDNTIRYIPNLASGDYEIYYQKSTHYGFYIKINNPYLFEGPFKELKFTDYITHPDYVLGDKIYSEISDYNPNTYETNEYRLLQDCSGERGQIISESSYDKNENLFERTVHTYVRSGQGSNKYSVHIHNYNGFLHQLYKSCYYPFQLSKTIHEFYDRTGVTNNVVTTTTHFEYNGHNLLRKLTNINSKNEEEISITNYSGDMQNGIYPRMKEKNMLSLPVEKTRVKNNYVTGSELTTYKENPLNNDYVPDKVYKLRLNAPIAYSNLVCFNGLTMDSHYGKPEIEYTRYDRESNITEAIQKDFHKATYYWSDDGLNPVATFENARNTYSVVSQYQDVWATEYIRLKYTLLVDNIRNYEFRTSKSGTVEFRLSGALGYNWFVSGNLDGKPITLVQIRSSVSAGLPWTNYQTAYTYKATFTGIPAGYHTFRLQAVDAYKGPTAGNYDGDLSYSYWRKESIAPEITGNDDVFYNNFESYSYTVVPFGFHSDKSHLGPYAVSLHSNPGKTYSIDYQVYRGGKWHYVKHPFSNGSYTIDEGNDPIDDVRVYPDNAVPASFNYFPLVGLRSKTDDQGVTESYEYDPIGRLTAIRDNERTIVKQFDYHYYNESAGPGLAIPYYSVEVRNTFTRNNCNASLGELGKSIEYVVPAGKFTSSISQEDANMKAFDALMANGQQYANEHAECGAYVIVSVYNPLGTACVLNYDWGVQGSITTDRYEIPASTRIADTGDPLQDFQPTVVYVPRRYFRQVYIFTQEDPSSRLDFSMRSSAYGDVSYDVTNYPGHEDVYVIGGYPFDY